MNEAEKLVFKEKDFRRRNQVQKAKEYLCHSCEKKLSKIITEI